MFNRGRWIRSAVLGMIVALCALGVCTEAPAFAGSGPVGHWKFDGNFADSSPLGLHATPQDLVQFVPGVDGQAASFDGVDDWLRVDHAGLLTFDLNEDSFSVCLFARILDPEALSDSVLQDRFGSNDAVSYNINAYPGELRCNSWFGAMTNEDYEVVFPDLGPALGSWIHIAVVYHPLSGKQLFINGTQVDARAPVQQMEFEPNGDGVLTVGAGWYPASGGITNFFEGEIDDLRIYDRALSCHEIRSLAAPLLMDVAVGPVVNPQNGNLYYLLTPSSWDEAEARARMLGGHLVTIETQAENDWLVQTFGAHVSRRAWIGLSRPLGSPITCFEWVSGILSEYRNWQVGQPDNNFNGTTFGEEEPFVEQRLSGPDVGLWNDSHAGGDTVLNQGIVEIQAPGCLADLNGDQVVDTADLGILIAAFGSLCP